MSVPRIAPFVPLLSSTGVFRLLGVSFGGTGESLPPSLQRFARATAFRAAGYQAAAARTWIGAHVGVREHPNAERARLGHGLSPGDLRA